MSKVLIVTVGGSPAPIIKSIKDYQPAFIYFICSKNPQGSEKTIDGPGDPCGDTRKAMCPQCNEIFNLGNPKGKSIVVQCGLNENQYKVFTVENPDNLTECYNSVDEIAQDVRKRFGPTYEVTANYTGGTKTMSVALAYYACVKPEWKLGLNVGPRPDIIKVRAHDVFVTVNKTVVLVDYQCERIRAALQNYDYSQAEKIFLSLLQEPLDNQNQQQLLNLQRKIKGFNLWDHFRHEEALDLIQMHGSDFPQYIVQLKEIMGKIKKSNPFARVSDLLNNARRRAIQKRYDDAIARLYRATEMFAQVIMRIEYQLDSPNLLLKDLPTSELQEKYEAFMGKNSKLLLGLEKSYHLLADLEHKAGELFMKNENRILSALTKRNNSILAHGETPLTEKDYLGVWDVLHDFLRDCSEKTGVDIKAQQLPGEELLQGNLRHNKV